jgi:hypothetical protein
VKAAGAIAAVLSLLVVMPIWYYLLYQVLVRVNASEVMWLLFWVYLPVALITGIITKIVETKK